MKIGDLFAASLRCGFARELLLGCWTAGGSECHYFCSDRDSLCCYGCSFVFRGSAHRLEETCGRIDF